MRTVTLNKSYCFFFFYMLKKLFKYVKWAVILNKSYCFTKISIGIFKKFSCFMWAVILIIFLFYKNSYCLYFTEIF